jgi:hypothetical protein
MVTVTTPPAGEPEGTGLWSLAVRGGNPSCERQRTRHLAFLNGPLGLRIADGEHGGIAAAAQAVFRIVTV